MSTESFMWSEAGGELKATWMWIWDGRDRFEDGLPSEVPMCLSMAPAHGQWVSRVRRDSPPSGPLWGLQEGQTLQLSEHPAHATLQACTVSLWTLSFTVFGTNIQL